MEGIARLPDEALVFLVSGVLFAALAIYSFRHKQVPGAQLFGWVMLVDVWWMITYVLELSSVDVEARALWLQVKYLAVAPSSLLWMSFTLEMTGKKRWLNKSWYRLLWAFPVTLILIVFTNPYHSWFWTDIHIAPGILDTRTSHGPAYDAYVLFTLVLGLLSLILFIAHSVTTVRFYRRRNLWLIAGQVCPYIGFYFHSSWNLPLFDNVDPVPLMLAPASIFMSVAIYRYQAMDIVPLAQRLVFENIHSGVIVVDPQEQVVAINRYAGDRWPAAAADGVLLRELLPDVAQHDLRDQANWEFQDPANGDWFLAMVSQVGSATEGVLGHALVLVDITERRVAEQARTEALAMRSQFLATVSHELRTPLHATTGFLELALATALTEVQRGYLERAQESSRTLLALINDVLDQSRMDSGQMTFEHIPFDLGAIAEQIRSDHSVAAYESGIALNVNSDNLGICLLGDPLRLTQVLTNLTSNAIKFTHTGSVDVNATVVNEATDQIQLEFSVSDTGVGIAPERVPSLFEPFSQADSSTTRRFGGTGLGLTISQTLVRGMGGQISVDTEPDCGSSFKFTLWFEISDEEAVFSVSESSNHLNLVGINLLVVDDTPVNLEIVESLLAETGASVTTAENGKLALEAAKEKQFDIVLMDIHMPEMDGYEASLALRDLAGYAKTPVVAMTASVLDEDRAHAVLAGMNDLVAKPFNQQQLFETLQHHLHQTVQMRVSDLPSSVFKPVDATAIVDLSSGLAALGGNEKRHRQLLRNLTTDIRQEERRLQSQEDSKGDIEVLHKFAGAAGMLGARKIAQSAREFELLLQSNGSKTKRSRCVFDLLQACEELEDYFNSPVN